MKAHKNLKEQIAELQRLKAEREKLEFLFNGVVEGTPGAQLDIVSILTDLNNIINPPKEFLCEQFFLDVIPGEIAGAVNGEFFEGTTPGAERNDEPLILK